MVNLVIRMRSCGQSVLSQDFVASPRIHRTTVLSGVSTRGVVVACPYRAASQILAWSNLKGANLRGGKNAEQGCDGH